MIMTMKPVSVPVGRCVHVFACVFYRIKRDFSPDPEQVELFYSSRNVDENVSRTC